MFMPHTKQDSWACANHLKIKLDRQAGKTQHNIRMITKTCLYLNQQHCPNADNCKPDIVLKHAQTHTLTHTTTHRMCRHTG